MRYLTIVAVLACPPLALAQETRLRVEVSPAEVRLGGSVTIQVVPANAARAYGYEVTQLSVSGAVIGSVACNHQPTPLSGSKSRVKWTPKRGGTYQVKVTTLRKSRATGSARVTVAPRNVEFDIRSSRGGRVTVAKAMPGDPLLPSTARYQWVGDFVTWGGWGGMWHGTLKKETTGPVAEWGNVGVETIAVDVTGTTDCRLIASGSQSYPAVHAAHK